MSYDVSITNLFRRAATYVDKISKGAKPAKLPVGSPQTFEFIINLKAAKQIGLTIPPNVLARADTVIKQPRGDAGVKLNSTAHQSRAAASLLVAQFRCEKVKKLGGTLLSNVYKPFLRRRPREGPMSSLL